MIKPRIVFKNNFVLGERFFPFVKKSGMRYKPLLDN